LNDHTKVLPGQRAQDPLEIPPERPLRRFLSALRPYPFEIAAWIGLITAVAFLRSHGLRIGWQTFDYTIPPLLPVMAKYFLGGIILYGLYTAVRRESPRRYLRQIGTVRWIVLSLRVWIAVMIFNYTYFWLKVCIPFVNPRLWDEALWKVDSLLHFGISPSILLVESASSGLLAALDLWYGLWLASVSLSIAFFCASPKEQVRRQFLLSCVLIWVLGAWIYTAIPVLGPIYVFGDVWQQAMQHMPSAEGGQQLLLGNYQTIMRGIADGQLYQFNPTQGIAAMPSLHVGVHWMLMLWMRRYARPLFLPAVIATLLTFLGSIATGWHYAIDGYVGIALGQFSYWAALRWERGDGLAAEPSSGDVAEGRIARTAGTALRRRG
jgi:hypothetical protein